jgi:alpha-methylacyl-CoA racemase
MRPPSVQWYEKAVASHGPLHGIRVIELAGIGPAPFCTMVLGDLGADVLRVHRPDAPPEPWNDALGRGKHAFPLDLKADGAAATVLHLVERAHVLVEGFRPGVAERLGVGPEPCLARNPRLVYGRMTGWGQDGPYSGMAGHDIDYIALTGALAAIGKPPLNLVGDFGGGGLVLALGIVAALHAGVGQVVDAAMTDGAALLMTMTYGLFNAGLWTTEPGANLLDGGAPFYDVYETADGKHVAVGALEPQFYAELLRVLELDDPALADHRDRDAWPAIRAALDAAFRSRTRDEWEKRFAGTSACVVPVLALDEAPHHPHNRARGTFVETPQGFVPAPAPRFSETQPERSKEWNPEDWGLNPDGTLAR